MTAAAEAFARTGRVWLRGALDSDTCSELRADIGAGSSRLAPDHTLMVAAGRWLAPIRAHWPGMAPVRGVVFDKTRSDNWGVPWHQDRIIAVRDRIDLEGYSAWSRKGDMWHCAPPVSVLQHMLFVRIHLDDTTAENGAMEIALGSHRAGAVPTGEAEAVAAQFDTEITEAQAGDILVLHMLILHRSPPSQSEAPRCTLRFDLADRPLPHGLSWAV
ncbi:phytanoyl-CoA dioxygenase family protein [Tateyamaria sp. SN3-11]|uniref:phytanoyl-CoA dioxygenase family protein n=1 Tax=Tateyamaria sp. SN3-11 TaxID=3092147 RepID=UPI0039ED5A45